MRHPFLRTLAGTTTDPNFENVTLLLHGDGTNGAQNAAFVDSGPNNLAVTRNGNVLQGVISPYGDNWSNVFDGAGGYLRVAYTSAFDLSSGDFTIEGWFNSNSFAAAFNLIAKDTAGSNFDWAILITSPTTIIWYTAGTAQNLTATVPAMSVGVWYHVAYVRSSGTNRIYLNGVSYAQNTMSITNASQVAVTIGCNGQNSPQNFINGYISNLRLVKGTAVYTSNFTPPTAPLTAISGTSLLTCQSNRFRDASPNNFTTTRNGGVYAEKFSPFSPLAAYSASTNGGSAYFSATAGQYLQVNSATVSIGTDPFTLESWIYYLGGDWRSWYGIASGITYYIRNGTLWAYYNGGASVLTAGGIAANVWTHIAVTRDSSNVLRAFVNGVLVNSATGASGGYFLNNPVIGERYGNGEPFYGYISGFRLLIGSALYTSTFTVPTIPPTSITNTRWIMNCVNAGIIDNAMMSTLEPVGNAQISTTVKKYGTGSLAFDGAGDWLRVQSTTSLFNLSTGDFTIEFWFYGISTGTSSLIQQGTTDWRISYTNNGVMRYEVGVNSVQTSTGAFSLNTWNHLAVCKSGTTTTLYINGTSRVTTTNSPINSGNPVYIGVNIDGGSPFWPYNGYIDDLRITKGVARYTSNFTPPTAAFPDL